jgi:hypothetical protein
MNKTVQDFIEQKVDMINDYPDYERVQWLKSRQWYTQDHDSLNQVLQKIVPRTQIVATPNEHIPIKNILENGKIFQLVPIVDSFENSRCHDNCDKLYAHKQVANVCTGFALSADGLWRYHSWAIDFDNFIIETTEERLLYFGFEIYQTRTK